MIIQYLITRYRVWREPTEQFTSYKVQIIQIIISYQFWCIFRTRPSSESTRHHLPINPTEPYCELFIVAGLKCILTALMDLDGDSSLSAQFPDFDSLADERARINSLLLHPGPLPPINPSLSAIPET